MTDRQPGAPGQYKAVITAEELGKMENGEQFAITMVRDDQPIVEGTPYSKAAVLPDDLASAICPDVVDPTPADALSGLYTSKAPSGFGLGEQNGRRCTDCNEAVQNGWYRLSGSGCLNVPAKITSSAYGTLFVETRTSNENTISVYQRFTYGKYYARRQGNAATGVWEEWEYENPPMEVNTEYRTTERFQSKPVYVRLIDFGALPNAGDKLVSIAVAGSLVVSMHGTVLSESGSCLEFPFIRSTMEIGATAYINAKGELHVTTAGDFRKYTAKFVVKYTKE